MAERYNVSDEREMEAQDWLQGQVISTAPFSTSSNASQPAPLEIAAAWCLARWQPLMPSAVAPTVTDRHLGGTRHALWIKFEMLGKSELSRTFSAFSL